MQQLCPGISFAVLRDSVFYYNPNIYPEEEYGKRVKEQEKLIESMNFTHPVTLKEGGFLPEDFYRTVKGYEGDKEGGERCFLCYRLRLLEAAKEAAEGKYDYFTTTLSISPLKNAEEASLPTFLITFIAFYCPVKILRQEPPFL